MLLVLDVGNTHIVLGIYQGEKLTHHWRIATDLKKTADEYWVLLSNLFQQERLTPGHFTGLCISSVVPPLDVLLEDLAARYIGVRPLFVAPGTKTGLSLLIDNPHEVGADRIVNAVATLELYGGPAVVVDFGTATTFDAVTANAEYRGGAIAPGMIISGEALFQRAAKLPRVDFHAPPKAIGTNTVHSIRSGLILGYAALVDGMVARIRDEMGEPQAKVVATGGLAPLMASQASVIQFVEPDLTLFGLKLIFELNQKPRRRKGAGR